MVITNHAGRKQKGGARRHRQVWGGNVTQRGAKALSRCETDIGAVFAGSRPRSGGALCASRGAVWVRPLTLSKRSGGTRGTGSVKPVGAKSGRAIRTKYERKSAPLSDTPDRPSPGPNILVTRAVFVPE